MFKWFTALTEVIPVLAQEEAVEVVETVATNSLVALPLFTKGLLVTLMGLLGVFLVLTLFFVTIKLMQKISPKEAK